VYCGIAHAGAGAPEAAPVAREATTPRDNELNFHLLFISSPFSVS
jgi:hypothetical protein